MDAQDSPRRRSKRTRLYAAGDDKTRNVSSLVIYKDKAAIASMSGAGSNAVDSSIIEALHPKRQTRDDDGGTDCQPTSKNLFELVSPSIPKLKGLPLPLDGDVDRVKITYALQLKRNLHTLSSVNKDEEEVAQAIEETIKRTKQELTSVLDSYSPLLSLDGNVLTKVVEYLDEESLYNCELASYSLNEFIAGTSKSGSAFWRSLYTKRQLIPLPLRNIDPACPSEDSYMNRRYDRHYHHCNRDYNIVDMGAFCTKSKANVMTRTGRHFGLMASTARKMEHRGQEFALLGDSYLSSNCDAEKLKKKKRDKLSRKRKSDDVDSDANSHHSCAVGLSLDFEPFAILNRLRRLKQQNADKFNGFLCLSKQVKTSSSVAERKLLWQGYCECHFDQDPSTMEDLEIHISIENILPHLGKSWKDIVDTAQLPEVRTVSDKYDDLDFPMGDLKSVLSARTRRWLGNQFSDVMSDVYVTLLDPQGNLLLFTSGMPRDAPTDGNDLIFPDMLSNLIEPYDRDSRRRGGLQVRSNVHLFEKDLDFTVQAYND